MEPDEEYGPNGPVMISLESTKIIRCVNNTAITSVPFCVHPSLVYRKPVTTKVSLHGTKPPSHSQARVSELIPGPASRTPWDRYRPQCGCRGYRRVRQGG
eukprot:8512874-Pyramimonas_sp.AAC.1